MTFMATPKASFHRRMVLITTLFLLNFLGMISILCKVFFGVNVLSVGSASTSLPLHLHSYNKTNADDIDNTFDFDGYDRDDLNNHLQQQSKTPQQMCIPQGLTCPRKSDYHRTCKHLALIPSPPSTDKYSNDPPPLPSVHDPDLFLQRLLKFAQGKHIALVGDSLTRQWFETLGCRLGLHLQFYTRVKKKVPQRIVEARQQNITIANAKRPTGSSAIFGYMRAIPNMYLPLYHNESLPSLNANSAKTDGRCQPLRTTLEYYKLDKLDDREVDILDFVSTMGNADIIVFNIGVHYSATEANRYLRDLRFLMQQCDGINLLPPDERGNKKLCLFRETFPRHWVSKEYVDNDASLDYQNSSLQPPKDWKFDKTMFRETCGPYLPGIYPYRYNHNSFVEDVASHYNDVGVVHVEHFTRNAWKWHETHPLDCTHWCHDDELWDLVHESLIDTAIGKLGL